MILNKFHDSLNANKYHDHHEVIDNKRNYR